MSRITFAFMRTQGDVPVARQQQTCIPTQMTPTHKSFTNGRIEAEVVAASLPTLALLVFAPPGNLGACLTVLGLGGSLWVARRCVHMTRLPRSTWPVLVCLAVAAVVRAPMGSQDMWSYAFFGRLVADYGADPYSVVANQHPHDLVVHLVGWRNTPSGYGPLFTLYSAAVAQMAGRSLVLLRLGFQIPAAASVLVCLRYLSTRGKTAAVLLIGLQPMIWLTTVNGGHNDALVALALLGAVVAFSADRTWAAAAAVAVAALIKLSSLLLVVPVCVVLVCRGRRRSVWVWAGVGRTGPPRRPGISEIVGQRLSGSGEQGVDRFGLAPGQGRRRAGTGHAEPVGHGDRRGGGCSGFQAAPKRHDDRRRSGGIAVVLFHALQLHLAVVHHLGPAGSRPVWRPRADRAGRSSGVVDDRLVSTDGDRSTSVGDSLDHRLDPAAASGCRVRTVRLPLAARRGRPTRRRSRVAFGRFCLVRRRVVAPHPGLLDPGLWAWPLEPTSTTLASAPDESVADKTFAQVAAERGRSRWRRSSTCGWPTATTCAGTRWWPMPIRCTCGITAHSRKNEPFPWRAMVAQGVDALHWG